MAWYDDVWSYGKEAIRSTPLGALLPAEKQPGQEDLRKALEAAAYGKAPSAAEEQMKMGLDRASSAASSLAASQPGVAPGAALRQALQAQGALSQGVAGQTAMLRADEQERARQMLMNQQQNAYGNKMAERGQRRADFSTLATGAMQLSDERQKKNVGDGDSEAEALLDALNAVSFEYKNPQREGAGPGQQLGVMAQDVEQAPMGDEMVDEVGGDKMIDTNEAVSKILAMLGNLHGRVKAFEGR